VRVAAVTLLLSGVLGASALDLTLGALWVTALVGVLLLRRRIGLAAPLVLIASVGLIVWGAQLGWFPRPAPAPYEKGWLPDWPVVPADSDAAADPRVLAARDRLRALRHDELRLTGAELEQRAGAVILLARRLDAVRAEAPREVAAVEAAARRLARTLAAPEFRNLETRRAAGAAHLAELDRRLGALREASGAAEVLRAADPTTIAHVSLRPVRDDLAAAASAAAALVRALGGRVPSASVTTTARYREQTGVIEWEVRHAVGGESGMRLLRIETRAFRNAGRPGQPLRLTHAVGEETPRPIPSGDWLDLGPASRTVSIIAAWTEPAIPRPVRSTLRLPVFERLELTTASPADDALVTIALDRYPGIEMPLTVALPPPALARVTVPRHALFFVSPAGEGTSGPDGDSWVPADGSLRPIRLDLAPRTVLLRNQTLARLRPYLYRPNPLTLAVIIGVAALTLVLVGRRRSAPPATR
jgi:hypothetical protein